MRGCNRLAAIWLFILAFQLFQASITYGFMCRHKKYKEEISVKDGYNCKSTKIKLGMCVGACDSHAVPVLMDEDDGEPKFQTDCKCCAPKEIRLRTVRFGDECERSIVVSQIRSCECKNCSQLDL